jgi:site-specific recombinase XerD
MDIFCEHRNACVIGEYVKRYLSAYRRRKYSSKSLETYQNALNSFERYLMQADIGRIQDITYEDLSRYRLNLVERNFTDPTIDIYLRTVRSFFKYLEDNQHIFTNPARDLTVPRYQRKLLPVPSEDDMEKVLSQPNTATSVGIRDRALIETAYTSGVRRAELARLTIFDPDLKQGTLRVKGKGRKERVVPLGKQAVFWLRQYLEHARPKLSKDLNEHALWISRTGGKKLSTAGIALMFHKYGRAAGLSGPLSVHAVRRACVTHMLQNGAHPVEIQMLLGHSNLKSLSQYLRVTVTDLKKMHQKSRPGR